MPEPTRLNHPPIVEALLHFRANASRRWSQGGIKELALSLFPSHTQVQEQNELQVELALGEAGFGNPVRGVKKSQGSAYMMRSNTEPTVHQVRRDGYSYSRLTPYEDWECFVTAAKTGWKKYADAIDPEELDRVVVRFINRLDFPLDEFRVDPDSFLTNAPRPPGTSGWEFASFSHSYALTVPDAPCVVNFNLAKLTEAGQERFASMLLDIEVLLTQPLSALGMSVDEALYMMRQIKNEAFFHSLTDKGLSRYHHP